jgi:hypothetical protein
VQFLQNKIDNLTESIDNLNKKVGNLSNMCLVQVKSNGTLMSKEERITYCKDLPIYDRDKCLYALAIETEDPLLCDYDTSCITAIAIKYNKSSYCTFTIYESSCFEDIGK